MAKHGISAAKREGVALMEREQEECTGDGHAAGGDAETCAEEGEEEEEVECEDCLRGGNPLEKGEVVHRAGDERSEGGRENAGIAVELCHIAPLHEKIRECSGAPCDAHESESGGCHSPEEEVIDAGRDPFEEVHRT